MSPSGLRGPFLLGPDAVFPHPELAHRTGLLAVGGDLGFRRLLAAYSNGIFPWPLGEEGEPLYWFSPDPRFVLYPDELHLSRSLARTVRSGRFEVRYDGDFAAVIRACAEVPRGRDEGGGTWITEEMEEAYVDLHRRGIAHCAEAWLGDELVGGLYGVALGAVFFGESMFHRRSDASKVAFATLVTDLSAAGFRLVDCQQETEHLARFGARPIRRRRFLDELVRALEDRPLFPTLPGGRA
jgi:leucyl/phenylalanyl-tRNA--protein transferase